jgi:AbrB family looped-hinge helix DNA binding protein
MALARSKITSQGQISIPAAVRRKLGVGPGSVVEWEEDGDRIVLRRSGKYSSADIRRRVFPNGAPPPMTVEQMDETILREVLERNARH